GCIGICPQAPVDSVRTVWYLLATKASKSTKCILVCKYTDARGLPRECQYLICKPNEARGCSTYNCRAYNGIQVPRSQSHNGGQCLEAVELGHWGIAINVRPRGRIRQPHSRKRNQYQGILCNQKNAQRVRVYR